jgi:hypothetical protein
MKCKQSGEGGLCLDKEAALPHRVISDPLCAGPNGLRGGFIQREEDLRLNLTCDTGKTP